jgi:hypothetical protein
LDIESKIFDMTGYAVLSFSSDESFRADIALVICFIEFESFGAFGDFSSESTVYLEEGGNKESDFDG